MEDIKVVKQILTSPGLEGDTKIGMTLFCGLAKKMRISRVDTMVFIGLESEDEYNMRLKDFRTKMESDERFQTKAKLIENYLKLNF
jgi:hypothetical protein